MFESTKSNLSAAWPLSLLYVASATLRAGHAVNILDAYIGGCIPYVFGKHALYYTGSIVREQDTTNETCHLIGVPYTLVYNIIEKMRPDVVGVSLTFSTQHMIIPLIVEIIKDAAPEAIIVFGGSHATLAANIILDIDGVDYVVAGEGEVAFPTLLNAIEAKTSVEGIAGICYRKDNEVFISPYNLISNLDNLAFPAFGLVPTEQYFGAEGVRMMPMLTSRGCPFHCRFCSVPLLNGRKWRAHSAERVLAEITTYVTNGVKEIHFIDDNMSLKKERFHTILEGIISNSWKLKLHASQALHCATLDSETLNLMQRAGFKKVFVSAESGNDRVLAEEIGKTFTVADAENAIRQIVSAGMEPAVNLVVGMPGEKWIEIQDTVIFAHKMKELGAKQFWVSIATPMLGTELYQEVVDKGLFKTGIQDVFSYGEATFDGIDWKREDLRILRDNLMKELNG